MKRIALEIPHEYTAALQSRFGFDLSPSNLATRSGKALIAQHAKIVAQINKGLTQDRSAFLASDYFRKKEVRETYLLYYMTTNVLKIIPPLYEISYSHLFETHDYLKIPDLGTGTGAAPWGIIHYL
jgi:hypothetical protein